MVAIFSAWMSWLWVSRRAPSARASSLRSAGEVAVQLLQLQGPLAHLVLQPQVHPALLVDEPAVLPDQAGVVQRAPDRRAQRFEPVVLVDVVEGAVVDRPQHDPGLGGGGQHHHRDVGRAGAHGRQQLEAVHAGHVHVGHHHVEGGPVQSLEPEVGPFSGHHVVAPPLHERAHALEHDRAVVDQEDAPG